MILEIIFFFKAIVPLRLLRIFETLRFDSYFDELNCADNHKSISKYPGYLPILKIINTPNFSFNENISQNYINSSLIDGLGDFLKSKFMCFSDEKVHNFIYANIELLKNIYEHSNGIGFACITYAKNPGVICCYYDLGVGFATTVSRVMSDDIDSINAIKWGVQLNNTSKTNEVGGAGLPIVQDFIYSCNGILEIRSGNGRVQWKGSRQNCSEALVPNFFGSQINLHIPSMK